MSVRTEGAEWGRELPEGQQCFYCYAPIRAIAVFWMGAAGELWLHPACVVELTIRLYRDVHEVECGTNTYVARPDA